MKIALAQINYHIGNFEDNFKKIRDAIQQAKAQQADLVVFAELAVCGYPPRDFLEFNDFINRCYHVIDKIAGLTHGIAVIAGSPERNPQPEGKDLYNAAWLIAEGRVQKIIRKTLLPNYDVFDEYRYFEPNRSFEIVEYRNQRIALTICEDLWNTGNENPLYTICPMDELMRYQPELIINIAASPFDYDHHRQRLHIFKANCQQYQLPLFYVNHVGAQTELIFDGGSLVMNADGKVVDQLPFFKEDIRVYSLEQLNTTISTVEAEYTLPDKTALIHDALVLGIREYFRKLGFSRAILGLSGGIDSAVTAVLAARALGEKNVRCVLMPSEYSSEHSITDAIELANRAGLAYDIIPITPVYHTSLKALEKQFEGTAFDITEENLQARIRANILMALSNKFGYILLNTSNKSEAAVGYGTLYGDMCGGISVLGDVYKTQVYDLARYINKEGEIIPQNIIDKPPSAELRPGQKDTDSLPEYAILDKILYQYIELRKGPAEITAMGFDKALVSRVLRMVNASEYKRHQTPPILRVSPKAFGMGRRMPIVAKYLI